MKLIGQPQPLPALHPVTESRCRLVGETGGPDRLWEREMLARVPGTEPRILGCPVPIPIEQFRLLSKNAGV